jgi:hypothetical protein
MEDWLDAGPDIYIGIGTDNDDADDDVGCICTCAGSHDIAEFKFVDNCLVICLSTLK